MTVAPSGGAPSGGAPAPSNGAPAPSTPALKPTQAAPAAKSGTPKPSSPRLADGRFGPKDGAVGAVEGSPDGKQAEAPPEPRRLRMKLKTRGGEEDWEGGEEDVQRELQQGRAYARKVQELTQALQQRESDEGLFKSNLEEALRKRGVDPDEFAKERFKRMIDLESMSEEGRALVEERQHRAELEKELNSRRDVEKKVKEELLTKQARTKRVEKYREALAATGLQLETDAERREMIYRMAQTEAIVADEQGRHDFTPDELAKETVRRAKKDGKYYLDSLSVPQLVAEMGQERVTALLQHSIAEYEKAQGQSVAARPPPPPPADPNQPPESRYIDEREFERRQKAKRLERMRRR